MEYVVYLTHYKGSKLPPFYIGSTNSSKVMNGYNGSIRSKKYSLIYKQEQKHNKDMFNTRVLSYHSTREEALNEELRLQKLHSVVTNNRYFNESYAQPKGFFGRDVSGKNNPNHGNKWSDEMKAKAKIYQSETSTVKGKSYKEYYSEEKAEELIESRVNHFKQVAPKGRKGLDNNSGKCYYLSHNDNEYLFTSRAGLNEFCKSYDLSFNLLFTNINKVVEDITSNKQKSLNCVGLSLREVIRLKI